MRYILSCPILIPYCHYVILGSTTPLSTSLDKPTARAITLTVLIVLSQSQSYCSANLEADHMKPLHFLHGIEPSNPSWNLEWLILWNLLMAFCKPSLSFCPISFWIGINIVVWALIRFPGTLVSSKVIKSDWGHQRHA